MGIPDDVLDEAIKATLAKNRPFGWMDRGLPLLSAITRTLREEYNVGVKKLLQDRGLLDRIESRIECLANEGWIFWNDRAQRWEVNDGLKLENSTACSFCLDKEQTHEFKRWTRAHVKKCGSFPEVSGARWSFIFTPGGLTTSIQVKCLKCQRTKDLT